MWPKNAYLTTRGSVSHDTGWRISKHGVAYLKTRGSLSRKLTGGPEDEKSRSKKSIEKVDRKNRVEFPAFFEPQMRVTSHRFFSDYYHTTQDTTDLATDKV